MPSKSFFVKLLLDLEGHSGYKILPGDTLSLEKPLRFNAVSAVSATTKRMRSGSARCSSSLITDRVSVTPASLICWALGRSLRSSDRLLEDVRVPKSEEP